MAVTIKSRSIQFTGAADAYVPVVHMSSLSFKADGATPGERLLITDGAGDPIVDYEAEAAIDNAEFFFAGRGYSCRGLIISALPTTGVVTALLR